MITAPVSEARIPGHARIGAGVRLIPPGTPEEVEDTVRREEEGRGALITEPPHHLGRCGRSGFVGSGYFSCLVG